MLNSNQLQELYDNLCEELFKKIAMKNRLGGLNEYITKIGMSALLESEDRSNPYVNLTNAKLLIVGDTSISVKDIDNLLKGLNMPSQCYDLVPFSKSKHYNFSQLRYQERYSDVLFGPIPHSNTSKGDYSSVINMMKKEEGFPKIIVLTANKKLKISRSSLQEGIQESQLYQYHSSNN